MRYMHKYRISHGETWKPLWDSRTFSTTTRTPKANIRFFFCCLLVKWEKEKVIFKKKKKKWSWKEKVIFNKKSWKLPQNFWKENWKMLIWLGKSISVLVFSLVKGLYFYLYAWFSLVVFTYIYVSFDTEGLPPLYINIRYIVIDIFQRIYALYFFKK